MNHPSPAIATYRAADGRALALRHYAPGDAPRANVVLLHGIISHSGWYDVSCRALAQRRFAVHALDRRGSGLNPQARGDVDAMETWIRDVVDYLAGLRPSGLPTFLLGISWGGKLAPAVARARPDLLAGLGMLCPGIYAKQQPGWLQRSLLGLSGRIGMQRRSVPIPLQQADLFTDSPRWQAYIENDPLTLRRITLRFARQDLRLTRHTRASAAYLHLPSLLVLAGRDRIVDNERTKRFITRLAATDKTVREYSTGAHTLEFESDVDAYLDDLTAWLEHHCR